MVVVLRVGRILRSSGMNRNRSQNGPIDLNPRVKTTRDLEVGNQGVAVPLHGGGFFKSRKGGLPKKHTRPRRNCSEFLQSPVLRGVRYVEHYIPNRRTNRRSTFYLLQEIQIIQPFNETCSTFRFS